MKKLSLAAMIAVMVAAGCLVARGGAMPETEAIRANCAAAGSTLSQIEKSDTALRINRGYNYNEILNLMFAMNARLAANKIAAPKLSTLTAEYEQSLTDFRDNYDTYDDNLNRTISLKCQENPLEFYGALEQTRRARARLYDDVQKLKQKIDDYYSAFNEAIKERP